MAAGAFPGHATSATWLRSVTALASPLNGDPVVYGLGIPTDAARDDKSARLRSASPSPPPSPEAVRFTAARGSWRPPISPASSTCSLCTDTDTSSTTSPAASAADDAATAALDEAAASPPPSPTHHVRLFSTGWLLTTLIHILSWLDFAPLNTLIDLRLDHWHLSRRRHAFLSSLRSLMRALAWQGSIGQSLDNAAYEVQPLATRRINARTRVYDCTVYLSFAARRAPLRMIGRAVWCEPGLLVLFTAVVRELLVWSFSMVVRLGGATQRHTACEHLGHDPKEWAVHDGLLSVQGQRCPLGEACCPLPAHLMRRRTRGSLSNAAWSLGCGPCETEAAPRDGLYADEGVADPVLPPTPSTLEMVAHAPLSATAATASSTAATSTAVAASASAAAALAVEAEGGTCLPPGIWHLGELDMDHFAVCGGPLASQRCVDDFWDMYVGVRRTFPRVPLAQRPAARA